MRVKTIFFLAFIIFFNFTPTVYAVNSSSKSVPEVRGESACLIDVQSGQILFSKNPDEQLAPASTTKIMTGLLAIERGNLNDTVTVSSTMLNNKLVYGTQIYLEPGEKMQLKDLLYALLLNSANDAAVAIAEHIGGDVPNFVKLMNQRALEIGATKTHFINPSGLTDSGHLTTAHDLALIARVAYQNPIFAQYVRTKTHTISRSKPDNPTSMVNENKLLWQNSSVDGIKTGYTAAAQNCLVASMNKDGHQIIGVILKSPGREIYTDMQNLFNYGFNQYNDIIYKPAGAVISTITVNNEPVNLILGHPIFMTQKENEQSPALTLNVVPLSRTPLTSVSEGQVIANVEVFDGQTLLNTFPLKSARTVLPLIPKKSNFHYLYYLTGVVLAAIVLKQLVFQKKAARRRWRKQMRLTDRSESN